MKERGYIERLWREGKYRVLAHSKQQYDEIRELLKARLLHIKQWKRK
jgi:hypothetical protein